jgi:hypothetical protein
MPRTTKKIFASLTLMTLLVGTPLLTGCGGGGGSDSGTASANGARTETTASPSPSPSASASPRPSDSNGECNNDGEIPPPTKDAHALHGKIVAVGTDGASFDVSAHLRPGLNKHNKPEPEEEATDDSDTSKKKNSNTEEKTGEETETTDPKIPKIPPVIHVVFNSSTEILLKKGGTAAAAADLVKDVAVAITGTLDKDTRTITATKIEILPAHEEKPEKGDKPAHEGHPKPKPSATPEADGDAEDSADA